MIRFEVPIKTISEANCSEHWSKKSKRHQMQQFIIGLAWQKHVRSISLPCRITMTRLSPRNLDYEENLPMAFKWIKDEIGGLLFPEKIVTYMSKSGKVQKNKGHADSDPRVKWEYKQEVSKRYGVRIEIENLDHSSEKVSILAILPFCFMILQFLQNCP